MSKHFKSQWFHILLALADQERHGYGIQRDVLDRTDGELMLWPAMLYSSLATLTQNGLIAPVSGPHDEPSDERRQYYAVTPDGRERLSVEAERLAAWAEVARERNQHGAAKSTA